MDPNTGALGAIVPGSTEDVDGSECCQNGGIGAACVTKYTPRTAINDSTLIAKLAEYMGLDWDYSGFL